MYAVLMKEYTEGEFFEELLNFAEECGQAKEKTRQAFIEDLWTYMCDDSREIGRYYDSFFDPKVDKISLKTGSKPFTITKNKLWYDLANTLKIIKNKETGELVFMGGCAWFNGKSAPISTDNTKYAGEDYFCATGWIVTDE